MTFKPLTENLGEAVLTSFLEAFPVRTSLAQEKVQESMERDPVCGDTWRESSVKFDRNMSSWRTHQCLWDEDLPESSVILPKWGMMQNGVCWERMTLPPLTSGTGSGLWRTPAAQEPGISIERLETKTGEAVGSNCRHYDKETGRMAQIGLSQQVKARHMWPTPSANEDAAGTPSGKMQRMLGNCEEVRGKTKEEWAIGTLNPTWVEWLMGWPIGWTDLNPLETARFHKWPNSHGDC